MLIPSNYLIKNNEIPDDTIVLKCRFCGNEYAVPNDIIKNSKRIVNVCDNKKCQELLDKEVAQAIHLLMKSPSALETNNAIKKALGY